MDEMNFHDDSNKISNKAAMIGIGIIIAFLLIGWLVIEVLKC